MTRDERIDVANWKSGEIVETIQNEEEFLSIIVDVLVGHRITDSIKSENASDLSENFAVYSVNVINVLKNKDGLYELDEKMNPLNVGIRNAFKIKNRLSGS